MTFKPRILPHKSKTGAYGSHVGAVLEKRNDPGGKTGYWTLHPLSDALLLSNAKLVSGPVDAWFAWFVHPLSAPIKSLLNDL